MLNADTSGVCCVLQWFHIILHVIIMMISIWKIMGSNVIMTKTKGGLCLY